MSRRKMACVSTLPVEHAAGKDWVPYIIRYSDGSMESCLGTYANAERTAEGKKGRRGGNYVIA